MLQMSFGRWFVVVGAWLVLSGCIGSPSRTVHSPQQDTAPRSSSETIARLSLLPDPVVREEAKSRGGNGPVYTVLGKSYRVMESARGFQQEGIASWYGMKFHGRQTSNGERFDIYKLTAAHKHLPLPTYVRVTNLENGKKTIVRVNDRGPFHDNRIIDLSYAAAVKLGFHDAGVARVRVEVVGPTRPAEPQLVGFGADERRYLVRAGGYKQLQSADEGQAEINRLTGFAGTVIRTAGDGLYWVQVGPVPEGAALDRLKSVLYAADYGKPKLIPVR